MIRRKVLNVNFLIKPYFAYVAAGVIALTCWYGWTYEVFNYGGDLTYYGPLARLSGLLSSPVTGGLYSLAPQNSTSVLLVWLMWFVPLRLVVALTSKHRIIIRHGLLLAALCFLWFAGIVQSEVLRGVIAFACIVLLVGQWLAYRKMENGAQFVFLSLVIAASALPSIWLALNVARYYTYDGDSGRSQAYSLIVRSQDALLWVLSALLGLISVWVVVQFAHWLSGKWRAATEPSTK